MTQTDGATRPPADQPGGDRPLLRRTSTFRGAFFVGANLAGFVAANAFMYYLSTGRWVDFTLRGHGAALAVPLSDILMRPVSIFSHPWMIVVGGLLMATVIFVPIMVAVLYRLWVSGLFVLAVAVFGHSPVLAACLAAGCVIAARTRFGNQLPFLTLMAGLVSASVFYLVLYHLFFARGPERALLGLQRLVFHLPFILAMVTVVLAGVSVLGLSRLTRSRPGVIWPALLVLLAAPLWLFHRKVGPAELDYALLAAQIGPGDSGLPAQTVKRFARLHVPAGPDVPGRTPLVATGEAWLERRRTELTATCQRFLRRRPASGRGGAAMWILLTLRDCKLDRKAIDRGLVRSVYAGPSVQSVDAWRDLAEAYPDSPQASVAQYRMAVVALRQERMRKGWERLHIARSQLMTHLAEQPDSRLPPSLWQRVLIPLESLPGKEYCRATLGQVQRLIWLMKANKILDGTPEDIRAFAEYMKLWPFADVDAERLTELAAGSEKTELEGNFRFQAAMAEKDELKRAEALAPLAGEVNDSAIVANYELGRLAMRVADKQAWSDRKLKAAQEYFKVVINAPDNPYRAPAEEHLAWLARRRQAAGRP